VRDFDQAKLRVVSRKNRCPICEKPDWCGVTDDGVLAICMRVADGAATEAKNGGFVHVLKPSERAFTPKPVQYNQPEKPNLAPVDRRDAVYTAFLESLTLTKPHSGNLLSRGLSDAEAAHNLYASVPNKKTAATVCAELAGRFDLTGVPGFYQESGCWQLAVWSSGFFVPVRDVQGRIQACQIRFDEGDVRYRWLSSKERKCGASSGTPIHFARPWRVASTGEAIITEGALKADAIAESLDVCVVAVAGVSCFNDRFGEWLREQLPMLGYGLIGFDADWHSKPDVERAMLRLMVSVESAGLIGSLLDWSAKKGLDDLLSVEVGVC
jgi:hypothetical protein